jgi:predicted amidohydrolase
MVVAFGMPLQRRNRLYISHVIAGPEGIIGHYEKVHLAGAARGEGRVFTEGDEFKAFDVGGVCVGINICYDGRHPGSSLAVAHLGAEVILHPHGNTVGRLGANPVGWTANKKAYLGARSVDTCSYTLICNSVGNVKDRDGKLVRFSGGALVLDPAGEFAARSEDEARRPHMIVTDLDIESLRRQRKQSDFSRRRAEVYRKAISAS